MLKVNVLFLHLTDPELSHCTHHGIKKDHYQPGETYKEIPLEYL